MYKVMVVDDERIIREGIENGLRWGQLGLHYVGSSKDGVEAYEQVLLTQPDIIITDLRMPRCDGLQLIEKLQKDYAHIRFIVLSGYSDFEYAKSTMRYGVRHYLLKPCRIDDIEKAVGEIVVELDSYKSKERFIQDLESRLQNMVPQMKEQFLRDCILGYQKPGQSEWDDYKRVLQLTDDNVRIVLIQQEGEFDFVELFALRNIVEELFAVDRLLLCTFIGKRFLILLRDMSEQEAYQTIRQIHTVYANYYKVRLVSAYTEPDRMERLPLLYTEAIEYLKFSFYFGEKGIITKRDVRDANDTATDAMNAEIADFETLTMAIKIGNEAEMKSELNHFFTKLNDLHLDVETAVSYCIELYAVVIRQSQKRDLVQAAQERARLLGMVTLEDIRQSLLGISLEITQENYKAHSSRQSRLAREVQQIVQDQYMDEHLSLVTISKEHIFIDADYIGRLFKKEVGENFSHYLMKTRMMKASELILSTSELKIFEIAQQTGFGENYPYFSQVFKKNFACTPTEYKKR
jgi:two-component system response regulator YesN